MRRHRLTLSLAAAVAAAECLADEPTSLIIKRIVPPRGRRVQRGRRRVHIPRGHTERPARPGPTRSAAHELLALIFRTT